MLRLVFVIFLRIFLVEGQRTAAEWEDDALHGNEGGTVVEIKELLLDGLQQLKRLENSLQNKSRCPFGFNHSVDGFSKCYSVLTETLDWGEAQTKCQQLHPNGHLAVINSPLENQIATEIVQKYVSKCPTYDGNSRFYYGVWTSGQRTDNCSTPFVWKPNTGTRLPISYTNWHPGEPNCDHGRRERCIGLGINESEKRQWNDFLCNFKMCSLCEVLKHGDF